MKREIYKNTIRGKQLIVKYIHNHDGRDGMSCVLATHGHGLKLTAYCGLADLGPILCLLVRSSSAQASGPFVAQASHG